MESNSNLLTDATGFTFTYLDKYQVMGTATLFNGLSEKFKIYAIFRVGGVKPVKLVDSFYYEVKDAILTDYNKAGTLVRENIRAAISETLNAKKTASA